MKFDETQMLLWFVKQVWFLTRIGWSYMKYSGWQTYNIGGLQATRIGSILSILFFNKPFFEAVYSCAWNNWLYAHIVLYSWNVVSSCLPKNVYSEFFLNWKVIPCHSHPPPPWEFRYSPCGPYSLLSTPDIAVDIAMSTPDIAEFLSISYRKLLASWDQELKSCSHCI